MNEINSKEYVVATEEEQEESLLNLRFVIKTLILNWQWFVVSIIIFLGAAMIYIRYTSPVYQVKAKILIKDDDNNSRSSSAKQIMNTTTLGIMNNSDGFDNELEILKSISLAEGAVRDLKLYVNYYNEGRVVDVPIYDQTPVLIDLDKEHLDKLQAPVTVNIEDLGNKYEVKGKYITPQGKNSFEQQGNLPMSIKTPIGTFYLTANPKAIKAKGKVEKIIANIYNPAVAVRSYAVGVEALSKTTTIAVLTSNDALRQRAKDYLKQLKALDTQSMYIIARQMKTRTS